MESQLLSRVKKAKNVKYIFCDYYDTIIHRTVHPLKPFMLWAKSIKKDFDLKISAADLYQMRRATMLSLRKN